MMVASGCKGMFSVMALTSFLNRLGGGPSHFSELDGSGSPLNHALSSSRKGQSRINLDEVLWKTEERDGIDVR